MKGAYNDPSYFTAGIHTSLSAGGGAQQSPAQTGGLPPEAAHPGTGGTYIPYSRKFWQIAENMSFGRIYFGG